MDARGARPTKPGVPVTRKRAVNGLRERTTAGWNCTPETISRCGGATLVTGIETFPSASLIWPAGPGGGGGELAAARTIALGRDTAELDPALFVAVTRTRIRWPRSTETRTYVCFVAPAMLMQLLPPRPQRRHWYMNVNGCVPPQVPFAAVSVWPTSATPVTAGRDWTVGGVAAVDAPAMPTAEATAMAAAPAAAASMSLLLECMNFTPDPCDEPAARWLCRFTSRLR